MHVQYSEKYQGTLCFSGQAHASCPITAECEKYITYSEKFQGPLCFSGQAQVTQTFWIIKSACSIQWKISGQSVFQGKNKLLQNYECKEYIPYREKFLGNSVFQGKRKLLKSPECITYIQYSEKFQVSSVFQGKRRLLKTPE